MLIQVICTLRTCVNSPSAMFLWVLSGKSPFGNRSPWRNSCGKILVFNFFLSHKPAGIVLTSYHRGKYDITVGVLQNILSVRKFFFTCHSACTFFISRMTGSKENYEIYQNEKRHDTTEIQENKICYRVNGRSLRKIWFGGLLSYLCIRIYFVARLTNGNYLLFTASCVRVLKFWVKFSRKKVFK